MRRCSRCVLTENHADICFDEQGVCNYCLEFDESESQRRFAEDRESEFIALLEQHRGQGEYDCMAMLSGGKDSTYALYLLKEHYKLNVLGFTFDNGFEQQHALDNVQRAVNALEVDHLYFKPVHIKRLFRFLLKNLPDPSVACTFCKRSIANAAWKVAKQYDIRLVVSGDTKGQRYPMRRPLAPGADALYEKAIALVEAQEEFRPYLPIYLDGTLHNSAKMVKDGVQFVSPYHYMTWDGWDLASVLAREVQWQAPPTDYPRGATNCLLNLANVYLSRQKYGFSWYDTELSALIRYGEITRQEALSRLEMDMDDEVLDRVLSRLNLSRASLNLVQGD